MPQFHVLRETPDGSGNWSATGEVLDGVPRDQALDHAATLSTGGGRFAIYEYNSLRMTPPEAMPTGAAEAVTEHEPETVTEPQPAIEPAPEPAQDTAEHPTS